MAESWQSRPDRPAAVPLVRVRLEEQVARLKQEATWRTGTRNAITLVKEPALRVVLTVLRQGAKLHEHQAARPVTLEVLSGSLSVRAAGQTLQLTPGDLVAFESAVEHDVEAIEESAFLLTLANPA